MTCPKCNEIIEDDSKFCTSCGAKIIESDNSGNNTEPKDRAEKIYSRAVDLITDWASDDLDNKNYKKITKLLEKFNNEDQIRLIAYLSRELCLQNLPNFKEKKFEVISNCTYRFYWATYHGYILNIAKKEVDKEKLEPKVKSYEELVKKFQLAELNDDADASKCREAFINVKMGELEEIDPDITNLKHADYEKVRIDIAQSLNAGYVIAQVMWG